MKYTGLCIVYVLFGMSRSGCHHAMEWRSRSRTRNIEDNARLSPDVWKMVITAQQKDERQDNSNEKRLVRHHPSDLLHLLTREQIGGGQHGVVLPAL